MSLSLITDRTQIDVNRVNSIVGKYTASGWESLTLSEQSAFKAGLKGSYNYTDLNRVENAVATLAEALTGIGYSVTVTTKTDWTQADVQALTTQTGMENIERYRSNISSIRAVLTVYSTTPAVPSSMDKLTFISANDIEQILLDVEQLIYNISHTVNLGWALGIADIGLYGGLA